MADMRSLAVRLSVEDYAVVQRALNQLGDMAMPVVLVDTDGFWQPLLAAVDALVDAGFVSAANRSLLHVVATPADAVAATASAWV